MFMDGEKPAIQQELDNVLRCQFILLILIIVVCKLCQFLPQWILFFAQII